ncbi:glycosyltransferase family 2 protein [Hymenobacter latericus]|uniref:glycosyltransferase family 2 protein n=1 Tax=Hymenobacter sp. YIM 151858-1 TaxID=2987688 RepID=UPI002226F4D3|nr:glycosyltransferase family 2 protein [Hymenobacter sp. YIM 151858-1]UYZ57438.1 glycosyltransferase family 2 protein [Hymenobacter sp. YIM 151858-1]
MSVSISTPLISVISPVYQAGGLIQELIERLETVLPQVSTDYEIILIDDGSTDESWQLIVKHAARSNNIRGLRLSRNFGQHHAITAGLDLAAGTWVVVMDCDLQDRPEEIVSLYQHAQRGYDVVLAARQHRQDNWMKRASSRLFYRALSYLTGVKQNPEIANFGLYHRRVIDTVRQLRESIRYFPTMVQWAGFRQCSLPVQHLESKRPSTYNLGRRLRLATDIMLAYSDKPLRLTVYTGLLISVVAFLLGLITLLRFALGQITVPGYASLFIFMSFFSGLIILVLGIVGLYVGKTFEGVRNRPLYVIAATTPRN